MELKIDNILKDLDIQFNLAERLDQEELANESALTPVDVLPEQA